MREVLIRLSFEMLAVKHPSRGFSVPSLTLAEIEDLTTVRIHNDTFALRMAIMRGGLEWESRIIATHHVLSRTPRRTADDPQHTNEDWARAHAAFHTSLIAGAGIPLLEELSRKLLVSTELYRRLSAPSDAATLRPISGEHTHILEAVLDRDATRATELLIQHYQRSLAVIVASSIAGPADGEADDNTEVGAS